MANNKSALPVTLVHAYTRGVDSKWSDGPVMTKVKQMEDARLLANNRKQFARFIPDGIAKNYIWHAVFTASGIETGLKARIDELKGPQFDTDYYRKLSEEQDPQPQLLSRRLVYAGRRGEECPLRDAQRRR